MARPIITAARLREVLHYDLLTGVFTWLVQTGYRVHVGDVAGSEEPDGYVRIQVDGRMYKAHRLAWLYMTGAWPPHQIDHENTIRSDNWWTNLRLATHAQNTQNERRARVNNKCGFLGVRAQGSRWRAQIRVDCKVHHIGYFDTPEQAHTAYIEAKRNLHPWSTL